MKYKKQVWQAMYSRYIGSDRKGMACTLIRRGKTGPWKSPDTAPFYLIQFLDLTKLKSGRYVMADCKTPAELLALTDESHGVVVKQVRNSAGLRVIATVKVDVPKEVKLRPINTVVNRLLKSMGVSSLFECYRTFYKNTSCGVGVGFCISGQWVYCEELPRLPINEPITGFSVSGYVEGWDGECSSNIYERYSGQAFGPISQIYDLVNAAEQEASDIWNLTHGCEHCGFGESEEYSGLIVNPACTECGGHGTVI